MKEFQGSERRRVQFKLQSLAEDSLGSRGRRQNPQDKSRKEGTGTAYGLLRMVGNVPRTEETRGVEGARRKLLHAT